MTVIVFCVTAPVTNSRPKIVQRPSAPNTTITVTRGDNLTLECVYEGAPVPVVTWDKYGGQLPEGRYSQLLGKWSAGAMGDDRVIIQVQGHFVKKKTSMHLVIGP